MLNYIWRLLKETTDDFQKDEAFQLSAALAYYAMFSVFPLLLLLMAALGFVLGSQITVQQQIHAAIARTFSPQLATAIDQLLTTIKDRASTATGFGVVLLLIGASGVFSQLDTSFQKIWHVSPKPNQGGIVSAAMSFIREKLLSFVMVLAVGLLLLLSLTLTGLSNAMLGTLSTLPIVGGYVGFVVGLIITIALNTLIFALLYKYLPEAHVNWREVWLGAFITALVWELAKRLLALYVETSSFASAYGAVGTALVLMVWIYFSSVVLFFGAEFTRAHASHQRSAAPQAAHQAAPQAAPAVRATSPNDTAPGKSERTIGAVGGLVAGAAAIIAGLRQSIGHHERR
jgi:membrane protein